MQLETIRAVLTADSGQFITGMNRARGSLDNLVTSGSHSSRAMNVMKSGMVGLALQATNTAGPVGRLAQGLLMFGGGSGLVLGVAAGIGAIAYAYKALTADARETAKANDELAASLAKVSAHARLITERGNLADLQTQLAAAMRPTIDRFGEEHTNTAEVERLRERIRLQTQAITFYEQQATQQIAVAQGKIAADAERERIARERSLAALDKMVAKLQSKEVTEAGRLKGLNQEGAVGGKYAFEGMRDSLNSLPGKMRYGLEQAGISENMRDFGISVGRQFAMGMLEGIQSMKDLFKMILMSVLDFGIGQLLGTIFPPAKALGGVKGSAVGPASMSLNMSGMPAAANPMAAARDAQWQSFLRESVLVADSQGFRGGR